MRDREHGAQPLQIDVAGSDLVMRGHYQPARFSQRFVHRLACDGNERTARRFRTSIDQVQNGALRFADDRRVRLGDKVAHRSRVPVIPASHSSSGIHALLHHGPAPCR